MLNHLNQHSNFREALCACLCFTFIGLFNVGLRWEERSAIVKQITWELQSQLTLSESQTLRIMEINYEFYDAISKVPDLKYGEYEMVDEKINHLITLKNKKIMKILNEDQQLKWLKSYSF